MFFLATAVCVGFNIIMLFVNADLPLCAALLTKDNEEASRDIRLARTSHVRPLSCSSSRS